MEDDNEDDRYFNCNPSGFMYIKTILNKAVYPEKSGKVDDDQYLGEGGEEKDDDTINSSCKKYRCYFFFNFFIVGCINNNGYTMVHAGSSSIAANFGKKSLMGYFLFFMRGAGVASRYINGACCLNIPHIRRI